MEDICKTTLTLYFKTKNSYITADDFLSSINSSKIILDDFNNKIAGSNFPVEIIILPSEAGSYKLVIGLIVMAGGVLVSGIPGVMYDATKGFLKGLLALDKPIEEYTEDTGKFIRDYLKAILSKKNDELSVIIPNELNLDKSLKAKSDFYKAIKRDDNIEGISFNSFNEQNTIINRNEFYLHVIDDIFRDVADRFEYKTLQVYKPILLKKGSMAKWVFIDNASNKVFASNVSDSLFINKFLNGEFPLKQSHDADIITCKVQIKSSMVNGEYKEESKDIICIYSFNNNELRPLPDDFKINKSTPSIIKQPVFQQGSLFD